MTLPDYLISVDLGQVNDPTAVCVLERREEPTDSRRRRPWRSLAPGSQYSVTHLERLELGTSYVAIPKRIRTIEERCQQLWIEAVWAQDRETIHAGRHVRHHPTRRRHPFLS